MKKLFCALSCSFWCITTIESMATDKQSTKESIPVSQEAVSPEDPDWRIEGDMGDIRICKDTNRHDIQQFSLISLSPESEYEKLVFIYRTQRDYLEGGFSLEKVEIYFRDQQKYFYNEFNFEVLWNSQVGPSKELKNFMDAVSKHRRQYKFNYIGSRESCNPDKEWLSYNFATQKIIHFLYDTGAFSDPIMTLLQVEFKKVGIQLYPSFRQFTNEINKQIKENETTSSQFFEIASHELSLVEDKRHTSYLSWMLVRHLMKSANFDHFLILKLLEFVDLKRYPKAEIRRLNLQANNPDSYLTSEKRQLLTLESLWKENSSQEIINGQIKRLYMGCDEGDLPPQLENVTPSLESVLKLLDLIVEQKKQISSMRMTS